MGQEQLHRTITGNKSKEIEVIAWSKVMLDLVKGREKVANEINRARTKVEPQVLEHQRFLVNRGRQM